MCKFLFFISVFVCFDFYGYCYHKVIISASWLAYCKRDLKEKTYLVSFKLQHCSPVNEFILFFSQLTPTIFQDSAGGFCSPAPNNPVYTKIAQLEDLRSFVCTTWTLNDITWKGTMINTDKTWNLRNKLEFGCELILSPKPTSLLW